MSHTFVMLRKRDRDRTFDMRPSLTEITRDSLIGFGHPSRAYKQHMDGRPFSSFCQMKDRDVSERCQREENTVVVADAVDDFAVVDAEVGVAVCRQWFKAMSCCRD